MIWLNDDKGPTIYLLGVVHTYRTRGPIRCFWLSHFLDFWSWFPFCWFWVPLCRFWDPLRWFWMAKRAPGGATKKDTGGKSSAFLVGYGFYCWVIPLLSIILCKWKELCSIVNRSVKVGNHQSNEIRGQCGEWDEDWEKANFTVEFKIWSFRPLIFIITIIYSLEKVSDYRERGRAWWKLVTTLPE